jgi:uncharacterized repeat protein (TIGR03803 family)
MPSKKSLIFFLAPVTLFVGLFTTTTPVSAASKERILHNFFCRDTDGADPLASLSFDETGNLYGTAGYGGDYGDGVVFELRHGTNGHWTKRVLHSFNQAAKDGSHPRAGVIVDAAGNVYGTTSNGGPYSCGADGCGVVFELTQGSNGTWTEKVLHSFKYDGNGYSPVAGLVLDAAGNLYGTTQSGGGSGCGGFGCGIVFQLARNANGNWRENVLYSFAGGSDGANPDGGVILDASGNLYGTTSYGGVYGVGTVFQLTARKNGKWAEKVLHSFDPNNNDGLVPEAGLTFDMAGNLYGTTVVGGTYDLGTVYQLTPGSHGGWKGKVLHSFAGGNGAEPYGGLIFDATGNLYGTTFYGGMFCGVDGGCGTVFRLTPGVRGHWSEKVLHSFGNGTDGALPDDGLVLDRAGHLYGTTWGGGSCNYGTVFEIMP